MAKAVIKADLHMHSTASDGSLAPAELARECLRLGITHAALSDHDTALGVKEFLSAARDIGLHAVSGLEYNVRYPGELHILAYGFDPDNAPLCRALDSMAAERTVRAESMAKRLTEAGYPITLARVREIAGEGVIGRPHIAQALFEAGFGADVESAFNAYLQPGCPGYLPRKKIESSRAIALARAAGAKCVFAHPGLTGDPDIEALTARLTDEGIEGIEAFYPLHTDAQVKQFLALAKRFGLFVTQGSDFHGATRKATHIGAEKRGDGLIRPAIEALFAAPQRDAARWQAPSFRI